MHSFWRSVKYKVKLRIKIQQHEINKIRNDRTGKDGRNS